MNGCYLNLTLHQWLVIPSLPASAFAHSLPSILSIIQMDWALKNKPTHVTSLFTSSQKQHTTLRKNPNVFTRAYKALLDEPPASLSSLVARPLCFQPYEPTMEASQFFECATLSHSRVCSPLFPELRMLPFHPFHLVYYYSPFRSQLKNAFHSLTLTHKAGQPLPALLYIQGCIFQSIHW